MVDYTQEGWQKEVMRITGGKGVDVVYDPVGMVVPSLKCVGWNGRVVVLGLPMGWWSQLMSWVVVVGCAAGTIEKVCTVLSMFAFARDVRLPSPAKIKWTERGAADDYRCPLTWCFSSKSPLLA